MQAWRNQRRGEPHFHLAGGAAGSERTWEQALSVGELTADGHSVRTLSRSAIPPPARDKFGIPNHESGQTCPGVGG